MATPKKGATHTHQRPLPIATGIGFALPVGGSSARDVAELANWCNGQGLQVIPWNEPYSGQPIAVGNSATYKFRAYTSPQATHRTWRFLIKSRNAQSVKVLFSSLYAGAVTVPVADGSVFEVAIPETLTAVGGGEKTVQMKIQPLSGETGINVAGLCCYENPAVAAGADITSYGNNLTSCDTGQPIRAVTGTGYHGAANAVIHALSNARRNLYHHSMGGVSNDGYAITSGSFTSIFTNVWHRQVPVLGRLLYNGDTTRNAYVRFRVKTASGTSGQVKVTAASGDSWTSSTFTGTAYTWIPTTTTTPGVIAIDCEDITTSTGLRGGAFDVLEFFAKRVSGAGNVIVDAMDVWEADP